jgi:hypothetical protein
VNIPLLSSQSLGYEDPFLEESMHLEGAQFWRKCVNIQKIRSTIYDLARDSGYENAGSDLSLFNSFAEFYLFTLSSWLPQSFIMIPQSSGSLCNSTLT